MPWIRMTAENWQDYLAEAQVVTPEDPKVNRGTFTDDQVQAYADPESNTNSMINYVVFNNYDGNVYTTKNISKARIILTMVDTQGIPPGYHGNVQYATGIKQVIDNTNTPVPQDGPYNNTGGIQAIAASQTSGALTTHIENYYYVIGTSIEIDVPNPGIGFLQAGSAIALDENDANAIITDDGVICHIEVFVEDAPEPPSSTNRNYVYEAEKGWSFDGNYIPHFLELNWLFEEDPFTYKTISKIRVHGLTKGVVKLQVQLSGMQGEVVTDYIQDYMPPQFLDLPHTPIYVLDDFRSVTNYVDYSDRGMALQMKFEGRNTDIALPEPAHVLQVLALQGTPQGNGKRAN